MSEQLQLDRHGPQFSSDFTCIVWKPDNSIVLLDTFKAHTLLFYFQKSNSEKCIVNSKN